MKLSNEIYPIAAKTEAKTIAYIRASTDKQDTDHQRLEILEFARKNQLRVDEYIEITISSRRDPRQRRIDELLQKLQPQDMLIVTELSRLGRSTGEVITLVNKLVDQGIRESGDKAKAGFFQ